MSQILKIDDDPRIKALLQNIMDEGSDEFEMVGYGEIRVIRDPDIPNFKFKLLIEVDVNYEDSDTQIEDTLQAGWNGSYEELFVPSERKERLLKIFYNSTYDLIGEGDEQAYPHH